MAQDEKGNGAPNTGGMHNSLPYVVRKALNDAGFSDEEIRDLIENQSILLRGLKRRYDARQGQTNSELASQSHKWLSS